MCSVFEQWSGDASQLALVSAAPLTTDAELALLHGLAEYPEIVASASRELAPHLLAFYLKDLAGLFHSYYNSNRFLVDDAATRNARLALAAAVRVVLANGLLLLGVSAPEKM